MASYKIITDTTPYRTLLEKDENNREINIYKLNNVYFYGNSIYPNCLFSNGEDLINPSSEKIMSLNGLKPKPQSDIIIIPSDTEVEENPLFYFVYNTDNYYHFVYDTLPYLISFFELRKEIPNLKLLMNYPNSFKKEFYKFVTEFLELLGITDDDIFINNNYMYKKVYISSSYTHGVDSNLPPRKEVYDFYQKMVCNARVRSNINRDSLPKKIYVSRRSWLHGDVSNMGTNYTNRRKLKCEDDLVALLEKQNIKEIFTENMSTIQKIVTFNNAELVIGAIGGGLCNVLFGSDRLNLLCLVSPTFLEVNYRFKYCFDKVKCFYFDETFHTEEGLWKKWMRVKSDDIIGEVENIDEDYLTIAYTDDTVSGWNSEMELKRIKVKKDLCAPLDKGLNSSWNFYLQNFWSKFFGEIPDNFNENRKNSIFNK